MGDIKSLSAGLNGRPAIWNCVWQYEYILIKGASFLGAPVVQHTSAPTANYLRCKGES